MSEYKPHDCDFCSGKVLPITAKHEPIRVRGTVVLLEGVTIGKCDRCGHRYFPADVVKRADEVARNPDRTTTVGILAA